MDPIKIVPVMPDEDNKGFGYQLSVSNEQGEAIIDRFNEDHEASTCVAELAPKLQTYTVDELVVLVLQFM